MLERQWFCGIRLPEADPFRVLLLFNSIVRQEGIILCTCFGGAVASFVFWKYPGIGATRHDLCFLMVLVDAGAFAGTNAIDLTASRAQSVHWFLPVRTQLDCNPEDLRSRREASRQQIRSELLN